MSKEYYWQKNKDSDVCKCWTKKEALKLLEEKGGRAWIEERIWGKLHIEPIKLSGELKPVEPDKRTDYFNK